MDEEMKNGQNDANKMQEENVNEKGDVKADEAKMDVEEGTN